jgi:hypothetical protein
MIREFLLNILFSPTFGVVLIILVMHFVKKIVDD